MNPTFTVTPFVDEHIDVVFKFTAISAIWGECGNKCYYHSNYKHLCFVERNRIHAFSPLDNNFYESSSWFDYLGTDGINTGILIYNLDTIVARSFVYTYTWNMYIECNVHIWDILCKIISGKYISMSATPEDIILYTWLMRQRMLFGCEEQIKVVGNRIFNKTAVLPRITKFTDCVVIIE